MLMPRKKNTNTNASGHDYTDSYFSGDQDKKKSNASYLFMIGGALITWSSRK